MGPLLPLVNLELAADDVRADVLSGLSAMPKTIPPKYLYDAVGSKLFEAICELDEYYPTRTELGILESRAFQIAERLGPGCLLFEPGSGSAVKVRVLLDHLVDPAGYVPIEISREHLEITAAEVAALYPELPVQPVHADYSSPFQLAPWPRKVQRYVVFYPGSTIGNFEPPAAVSFLERMASLCGVGGAILLGVDRRKDSLILLPAYDDPAGVTAAFNRNVLQRLNRELNGDFVTSAFRHRALWNEERSRIEMWLVAKRAMTVFLDGVPFSFSAGEGIKTEHSYKYSAEAFGELVARAGLRVTGTWSDDRDWFAVMLLEEAR